MTERSEPLERDNLTIKNKEQTARKGLESLRIENKEQNARKRLEHLRTRSKLLEKNFGI